MKEFINSGSRAILILGAIIIVTGFAGLVVAQNDPAGAGEPAEAQAETTKTEAEPVKEADKMPEAKPAEGKPAATAEPVDPKAPYKNIKFPEGERPRVVMETSMGRMVLELWPDVAPKHCQSFMHLVQQGFYDSLTFHRVIPGFVIQGGCPLGTGTGGPGYNVPAEFSNKPHEDGVLSMARAQDVNSAGSQFFICLGRLTNLDNNYTVFGKVVEGLSVAHEIEKVKTSPGNDRPVNTVYMTKVTVAPPKTQ